MLVSDDPGIRSFRSVRSFLSTLNSNQIPDLESNSVKVLKFLHLSASLPPGLISMGLWSWIHSQDSSIRQELLDRIQFKNEMVLSKANQTRLFSATGEQIKFPEHLLSSNEASNKNNDSNTKSAMYVLLFVRSIGIENWFMIYIIYLLKNIQKQLGAFLYRLLMQVLNQIIMVTSIAFKY